MFLLFLFKFIRSTDLERQDLEKFVTHTHLKTFTFDEPKITSSNNEISCDGKKLMTIPILSANNLQKDKEKIIKRFLNDFRRKIKEKYFEKYFYEIVRKLEDFFAFIKEVLSEEVIRSKLFKNFNNIDDLIKEKEKLEQKLSLITNLKTYQNPGGIDMDKLKKISKNFFLI